MISIQPDFIEVIKDPTCRNKFLNVVPRSIVIENLYAISSRNFGCVIKEFETKDDNT